MAVSLEPWSRKPQQCKSSFHKQAQHNKEKEEEKDELRKEVRVHRRGPRCHHPRSHMRQHGRRDEQLLNRRWVRERR